VFQVWLSKSTPAAKRGTIFGWSVTAKSIGWSLSPMVSGAVAVWFGTKSVYLVAPVLFLLLIPLISTVSKRVARAEIEAAGEPSETQH
jgi:MFS family permease